MTTGIRSGNRNLMAQPAVVPSAGRCKYGRGRRFRRAYCCVVFLLLINAMLLLHTTHSVGAIMWFMMNGSVTYKEDTFMFIPGGAKTFCNDFCVNMCIRGAVDCQLESCLNSCNDKLMEDGNGDEFEPLAVVEGESEDVDPMFSVDPVEDGDIDVNVMEDQDPQEALDQMQVGIELAVEQLRTAKTTYQEMCAEDPTQFGCDLRKQALEDLIAGVKEQMNAYDAFAVSFELDIRVEVWMVDMDAITAEP